MLILIGASDAQAADAKADRIARQHFKQGEAHYAKAQFAEALADYQAGYQAVPLPGFLVNIAQCHRRRGDLKLARASYEKFVLVAPDSPLVPEVRKLIAELDHVSEAEGQASAPIANAPAGADAPMSLPPPGAADDVVAPGTIPLGTSAERAPGITLTAPAAAPPSGAKASLTLAKSQDGAGSPTSQPTNTSARRTWLWAGTATALVIGGIAIAVALHEPDPHIIHDGTLGTLRR